MSQGSAENQIFTVSFSGEGRLYSLLADAVVLVHLLFITFVVAGGLLLLRRPCLAFLHLPAALWGAVIEFTGWICPLTPLENQLRRQAGQGSYSGGFIEQYIVPVIYPSSLSAATQYILGGLVIAVNLIIYAFVIRKHHRLHHTGKAESRDFILNKKI